MRNLKKNIQTTLISVFEIVYYLIFGLYLLYLLAGNFDHDVRININYNEGIYTPGIYSLLYYISLGGVLFSALSIFFSRWSAIICNLIITFIYIVLLFYFEIPEQGKDTWYFYRNFWIGMMICHALVVIYSMTKLKTKN